MPLLSAYVLASLIADVLPTSCTFTLISALISLITIHSVCVCASVSVSLSVCVCYSQGLACRYVGYALTTKWAGCNTKKLQLIGFDMGGTSTDVSRFAGTYEHVFESSLAGLLTCIASL